MNAAVDLYGSSPRARGRGLALSSVFSIQGFIPACAGEGGSIGINLDLPEVHPRVRGGGGVRGRQTRKMVRFIPACAGEGSSSSKSCLGSTVHPRVRGGGSIHQGRPRREVGSSPRARGKPKPERRYTRLTRFIPACAGETALGSPASIAVRVHPRARGRGLPKTRPLFGFRFIPACPRARGRAA